MTIDIRLLPPEDRAVLDNVAPDVFDNPVHERWSAEFLGDPRHHLAVAVDGDVVVGFASAVHYVHPDKPPELWINEVGVAPTHRGRGLGTALLRRLFEVAEGLGCHEAWVLTEQSNAPARRLYAGLGGRELAEPVVMFTFRLDDHHCPEDDSRAGGVP